MSDKTDIKTQDSSKFGLAALVLRIGLGLVFFSGGLNKLILLLNSNTSDAMVNSYMGTAGYVNAFFTDYLFTKNDIPFYPRDVGYSVRWISTCKAILAKDSKVVTVYCPETLLREKPPIQLSE